MPRWIVPLSLPRTPERTTRTAPCPSKLLFCEAVCRQLRHSVSLSFLRVKIFWAKAEAQTRKLSSSVLASGIDIEHVCGVFRKSGARDEPRDPIHMLLGDAMEKVHRNPDLQKVQPISSVQTDSTHVRRSIRKECQSGPVSMSGKIMTLAKNSVPYSVMPCWHGGCRCRDNEGAQRLLFLVTDLRNR